MPIEDVVTRFVKAEHAGQLKFSVCTVPGKYSWGQITSDEPTVRLLCEAWNNRRAMIDHVAQAAFLAGLERAAEIASLIPTREIGAAVDGPQPYAALRKAFAAAIRKEIEG